MFTCNLEHPLLAKEIIGVFGAPFGGSIDATRLVTAVFAIVTAAFCYLFVTDCTDRVGGLIAAAAWGLLPQAGIEGNTTLEAVRINRFGLLDPFVACFVALALWTGWRWTTRGGVLWAVLTGAACVGAACSKAPGALVAPVICLVPLIARRHQRAVLCELR
jgi:4-amino-4-deoxy-L-arabinose transferase-like glycosyltransferase